MPLRQRLLALLAGFVAFIAALPQLAFIAIVTVLLVLPIALLTYVSERVIRGVALGVAALSRWRARLALGHAVALLLAFMMGACATVRPVVDHIVDCSVEAVRSNVAGILDEVKAALATGDYMTLLADLATSVGKDAVICAVRQVSAKAAASPGAASDVTMQHARAYLEAEGAR